MDYFGKVEVKKWRFVQQQSSLCTPLPWSRRKRTGLDKWRLLWFRFKKDADYRFSVWARNRCRKCYRKHSHWIYRSFECYSCLTKYISIRRMEKISGNYQIGNTKNPKAACAFLMSSKGSLDLEHVSVFPVDTWKGHENGLRKDLAQALYDLKPGVFRFRVDALWKEPIWKPATSGKILLVRSKTASSTKTAGSILSHTAFSRLFQSYGMGFYEFFLLSEEIGAEPLPVISCGLACQFKTMTIRRMLKCAIWKLMCRTPSIWLNLPMAM